MRGEFIGVWSETWREIWLPLIDEPLGEREEGVPEDIFCELYRELAKALKEEPSIEDLADIIDDPVQSREAFESTTADGLTGERAAAAFFEAPAKAEAAVHAEPRTACFYAQRPKSPHEAAGRGG